MTRRLPVVLALGAWLKNTACLLEGGVPVWSATHGDLSDPAACALLAASARALRQAARRPIVAIAHDLHPDFYSTRLALALADEWGVPAIGVQHHHAHIAAVMAEHAVDAPVIGLALDGYGYGSDGEAWGGELLHVETTGWRRLGKLWPLALPGGDVAAREPWRMAASALHALERGDEIEARFATAVGGSPARLLRQLLDRGLHSPRTSSAGRWFDAAAGALGLSVRQSHEAEAAMALQQQAMQWTAAQGEPVDRSHASAEGLETLDLRPLLARLFDWPPSTDRVPEAAAWFHAAFGDALADWAAEAASGTGTRTVCLGGGCFLNPLLTSRLTLRLQQRGLVVLRPHAHSCGDAGLALGQAWVVAHRCAADDFTVHAANAAANADITATESLSCA